MPEERDRYLFHSQRWGRRAEDNIDTWGQQDLDTLLIATQEKLGELVQAVLEARAEDGDTRNIQTELDDLAALMFQLQWALEVRDSDGELWCPGCEEPVETAIVGTSPHIDTRQPVDQIECKQCGGVYDRGEFRAVHHV